VKADVVVLFALGHCKSNARKSRRNVRQKKETKKETQKTITATAEDDDGGLNDKGGSPCGKKGEKRERKLLLFPLHRFISPFVRSFFKVAAASVGFDGDNFGLASPQRPLPRD
jgi:hypothetical protein